MQEERFRRRTEEELKVEEIKLEIKKNNEDKDIIVHRNIQVNFPKLVITKFDGTHLVASNSGINSKLKLTRFR